MSSPNNLNGNGNGSAGAFAEWVIRWRWLVLVGSIAVALIAGSGASNLAFNNDYRVFFSEDNPELLAFEKLQRTYTKIDNILFAIAPHDDAVFTPQVLDAVEYLTLEAWQIPFVLRVDSITNYQHTIATDDDLIVADLVEGGLDFTPARLREVAEIATSEPALRDFMVAHEGHTTGVNVTFQMPQKAMDETPQAVAAARALAARIEAEYPVDVHLTGMVMLNNAFFEMSMQDMSSMVPGMYLIIIVVTLLLVRSVTATIGTVIVILLSLMTAMGLAGWVGIELTPPSSAAITIIMTLAVADSIHILISMLAAMRQGATRREALVESMRLNMSPVFLTSVTTAIGFLSLNFSDSPPFGDLGNITAVGMVAAFFYSVGFLPAFMAIVPVKAREGQSLLGKSMDRLGDWVVRRNSPIFVGFSAAAILLLAFIPSNELNDDFVAYFDESTDFRSDVNVTSERLTGAYQLQFSLESGSSNGVSDPAFLEQAGQFVDWLRSQPEVRHVQSITDTFKRLNKNLHGDDPSYYKLPEDRQLAAQYLLLYELSLPYGLDLNNQLNIDKSSTQIVATLNNLDSRRLRDIARRGESWLEDNTPKLAATGIGPAIMFAYISDRNIRSMLLGTFLAVVLISAILVGVLHSPKLGIISLVPNLLPAGLAFGAWGLFVGELNMAVSMVSGMTLGIVVDDTIHFLTKYKRATREQGLDAPDAVRYAFSSVGQAIVVTSLILIAGFSVLAQSDFAMNSLMALLTAIAIGMALLADFLLLPVLLIKLDSRKSAQTSPVPLAGVPEAAPAGLAAAAALRASGLMTLAVAGLGLGALFIALNPHPLAAQNEVDPAAAARGLEIAVEADLRDTGFGDFKANITMILRNKHGESSERRMRVRTLEQADDGDKSLIIFQNPGDVKGTAFLSFTHKTGSDDQWLYLPALKRVKRIASSNKSGPFMGSEFAYEDISSQEVEKYTYRYVGEEAFDDREHFVVERDPVDPKSGYSRQLAWLDTGEYRVWKVEFYGRRGSLLKTLTVSAYNQYLEKYWRADSWKMVNHQTGKETDLMWGEFVFANGFEDRDFNRNSLARAR